MRLSGLLLLIAMAWLPGRPSDAQGRIVHDSEPNNAPESATPAALHDTIAGNLSPETDVDFFALDLLANTELHLAWIAGPSAPVMYLIEAQGGTVAATGVDKLRYRVTRAGRYFLKLRAQSAEVCWSAGACPYAIEIGVYDPPSGPGDPTTVFASADWEPWGIAAGPHGEIYVADHRSSGIARIDQNGGITRLGTHVPANGTPAVMTNGDILVPSWDDADGRWWVRRVSPSGSTTTFFQSTGAESNSEFKPGGITIGPDGDVWVANRADAETWRFASDGSVKETIALPSDYLAFSPSGVLHATAWDGQLRRYVNGHAEVVFSVEPGRLYGLAFDRDGYLYVARGKQSGNQWIVEILLLDPQYHVVQDPFASSDLDGTAFLGLAFARSSSGEMTSQLLAANSDGVFASEAPEHNAILQVNQAAVRAPGWPIGPMSQSGAGGDHLVIDSTARTRGTVGEPYSDTLRASGGSAGAPTSWRLTTGTLPPGLTLAESGIISGTPSSQGAFSFSVRATRGSDTAARGFRITIDPSGGATDSTVAPVTVEQVTQALLGQSTLSAAAAEYLDRHGNHNGKVDVGDLRAFLRARGLLPSPGEDRKP
ncbi:MAG TPA: putative Ig domain-containing protein [Gemmatimonadales bacterium]|nr:putative Ig domain-containing protein [Gemmatimonadales bacterium]